MRESPARYFENTQEEELYMFSKQMLKSRIFKGFYKERCYIEELNGYRDQIIVNRNEKDLIVILDVIENRLRNYYTTKPFSTWIGITSSATKDTCLWVELEELAFDQYWFSIKSLRLRPNEVILKLKPIRSVDSEQKSTLTIKSEAAEAEAKLQQSTHAPETVGVKDFIDIFKGWGASTKQTVYNFMSKDISKENFAAIFKFFILACISLFSLSIEALRFLGIFTIHFMIESRKLIAVLTPIILKIIDICGKIVGGFYMLLAMVWRDVKKGGTGNPAQQFNQIAIAYNQPIYQRIKKDKISQRSVLWK